MKEPSALKQNPECKSGRLNLSSTSYGSVEGEEADGHNDEPLHLIMKDKICKELSQTAQLPHKVVQGIPLTSYLSPPLPAIRQEVVRSIPQPSSWIINQPYHIVCAFKVQTLRQPSPDDILVEEGETQTFAQM